MMFSRCPHCNAQYEISAKQLRESRGLLNCLVCQQSFDALPTLSERADGAVSEPLAIEIEFNGRQRTPSSRAWLAGCCALLLTLIAQIIYFESEQLLKQPLLYSTLLQSCRLLSLDCPSYNNRDELSLSHSVLQSNWDTLPVLTSALSNQAEFTQKVPAIKLSLQNYEGHVLTERMFSPLQFTNQTVIAANQTLHIRLPLIIPVRDWGGFTLSLI